MKKYSAEVIVFSVIVSFLAGLFIAYEFVPDHIYENGYNEGRKTEKSDLYDEISEEIYTEAKENILYDIGDILDKAYNVGYEGGLADGAYGDGYDDGYAVGEKDGYNTGHSEGYNKGHSDGYAKGKSEGYNSGVAAGKKEAAAQSTQSSSSTQQKTKIEVTVYVTDTGEKYHRYNCSYLKNSKKPISLTTAQTLGYTACSRCW